MGEVKEIAAALKRDNPNHSDGEITVMADCIALYCEAAKNVRENGAVVLHPRTGTPIDNPYLKIMRENGQMIAKKRSMKTAAAIEAADLAPR